MKKTPLLILAATLALPVLLPAQTTIFTDTFGSSSLNGTSTPGGTPSASSTSYDVASTKTGACTIGSGKLRETISSATSAGYVELQALFTSTPVQLVNIGDSINLTYTFTNSGNLLAGGAGSVISVGLFNSGGSAPDAGNLNNAGLNGSATNIVGGVTNWQGYASQINYSGSASSIYTRPAQTVTASVTDGVQDLLFSGASSSLFKYPSGTTIGSSPTSAVTLSSGATYTETFNLTLSAAGTITVVNNLYTGPNTSGTLLSAMTNTTTGGTTYTNFSNNYDGLAIGIANKGTTLQPIMDISKITITKNVYAAPTISSLTNETVIAGNNVTLAPAITGNPTPAYQWQTNGVNINGANSATLALSNVQFAQNGYVYSLIASNTVGVITQSMTLTVIVTPSISGLVNQAASVGDTVIISPTVTGVPTPTLQWQTNGVNVTDGPAASGSTISGSQTSTLTIANAQVADSVTYSLIASNSAGMVTNSMTLTVAGGNTLPTIVGPTNITVIQGNAGTFSASATAVPVPTLQWLDQTGTPIPGATSGTLVLNNIQYSQNGYVYSIVASNVAGSVTNSATLSVLVPPAITSQPTSLIVTNTQSASFSVGATGVPAVAYQWNKNGSPIAGATSATYTIASAAPSNNGIYSVTITNQAGTTNSGSVTLTVNSTMAATVFIPSNGQTGVCYDTPLAITFSQTPVLHTNGTIKIFNVTNSATPVDTINLALNAANGTQAHSAFSGDSQGFNYYPVVINGSTATIYPHGGVLTSNQTYFVTIDNGAFTDANGAYFAGITANNVWQFSTKAGGPLNPVNPVVNANGSGDFVTVQGAVDSLALNAAGALRTISIQNGSYFEIVDISGKTNVTLRGQSRAGTVVYYPNNANIAPGGTTHARMAFKVNANDVAFDNLTISNSTPQGGGQAEALMIESGAKRCIVNNCEIDSRQDTILANVNSSQGYFYNTTIKGNYDYIWGGGNLYFNQCVMDTIAGVGPSGANLTAARTDTSATTSSNYPWLNPGGTYTANGMSFVNCSFTADASAGTVTLADGNGSAGELVSWYGSTFATNYVSPSSSLFSGNFIFWQDLNTTTNNPVTYANVTSISGSDARLLAATNIPTWFYGWQPQLAPNILTNPASQTVNYGSPASFAVVATGIPDPTYQWQLNGTNLPGATSSSLTIASPTLNDAGPYTVIVTTPAGSATSTVATLTVNPPPNTPPVFTAPIAGTNITINVGVNLAVSCPATDSDIPAPTLTYSLLTGPGGSTVDPASGNFTWRPNIFQGNSLNSVSVVVSDNGTPALTATNNFTITVNALTAPSTGSAIISGGLFSTTITGQIGPDYILQATSDLTSGNWTTVATTNSPAAMPVILTDPNAATQPMQFYRIVVGPQPAVSN